MLKLLVLSVAVAAVWAFPRAAKPSFKQFGRPISSGRIIGGQDAAIADYPYQLALTEYGNFICGAVLIGSKWAVAAAHCTHGRDAGVLAVIAGSTDLTSGQTVRAATIYEHPRFTSSIRGFDISVLELAEDVTVENSAPIALHDSGYTAEEGADVTVTGWGVMDKYYHFPGVLQVVKTKVVSNEVCNDAYEWLIPVTDTMMCDGVLEGGKGACNGDSGGPVVVAGKLYGTVSWGLGCAIAGWPAVNSKISEATMREFVKNVTGI